VVRTIDGIYVREHRQASASHLTSWKSITPDEFSELTGYSKDIIDELPIEDLIDFTLVESPAESPAESPEFISPDTVLYYKDICKMSLK
jgi:hypothetical protein